MLVLIDILVGLIVVFLAFSIIVSGFNEWIAQALSRRGEFLRMGMQRLISDDAIYRRVLNHPLVGSLYRDQASHGKPPSYVEPGNFALALAEVLTSRRTPNTAPESPPAVLSVEALRDALQAPPFADSSIRAALIPIIDRAQGDLETALKGIEAWFSSGMDRVTGWYKARSQKMMFLIGLLLAAFANVDALEIYATLSRSPALRAQLAMFGEQVVKSGQIGEAKLDALKDRPPTPAEWLSIQPLIEAMRSGEQRLPIGYACLGIGFSVAKDDGKSPRSGSPWTDCKAEFLSSAKDRTPSAWLLKLFGWMLTALAGTLGAAYWFEMLNKVINLRGSGARPQTDMARRSVT